MANQFLPDLFGRSSGRDVFSGLQKEIDRVFSDFSRSLPAFGDLGKGTAFKVNVAETDGALEVTAEIPGVNAKDIDVQLKDGILTIRGEKKDEREEKDEKTNFHLMERSYGMFERSFTVGNEIDAARIAASFDKGVLKVTLPKLPEARSKVQKIEVKPA